MEMNILSKKENILLRREEVTAEIKNSGATPDRKAVTAETAKSLGVDESLVIVDKISTERGRSFSTAKILVYKKKEEIPKGKIAKMEKRIGGAKKEGTDPATPKK